ncbi:trans-sulfuration enzyme family protein [Bradyrhizobium manausense]
MSGAAIQTRRIETLAVHAGRRIDPATGAIVPPIYLSTTYERAPDGSYPRGFAYATFNNPNRAWLEEAVAEMDGAAAAIATSSGMAAIASVLSCLCRGERIITSYEVFQGTARLLKDQVRQWGIEVDLVDITNPDAVAAAITPRTRMLWIDTPSNPLMRVANIAVLADLAHASNIRVVVDNTFATFVLQRPISLGADVTLYAGTKFIAGHSDVVNGLAVFKEKSELYERARAFQINIGLVPSPFDCWMVHRGLRTLPLRMRQHSANAQAVATFLETHTAIEKVFYPGLPSSEWHALARKQMPRGCGGMMAIAVRKGRAAAKRIAARTKTFMQAASFGGVESLIEHRASSPIQTRGQGTGFAVPDNLLRLSIGIEHVDDLIADLDQALSST